MYFLGWDAAGEPGVVGRGGVGVVAGVVVAAAGGVAGGAAGAGGDGVKKRP